MILHKSIVYMFLKYSMVYLMVSMLDGEAKCGRRFWMYSLQMNLFSFLMLIMTHSCIWGGLLMIWGGFQNENQLLEEWVYSGGQGFQM